MAIDAMGRVGPIDIGVYVSRSDQTTNAVVMESDNLVLRPMIPKSLKGRAQEILPAVIWEIYVKGVDDIEALTQLFGNEENCKVYATTKPWLREAVEKTMDRDFYRTFAKKTPWTGYLICDKFTGGVLGRGALGTGYFPADDVAGSYQAAPLDEEGGAGPAEVQMEDFVVHPLLPREPLYRELILTLLTAAAHFIESGIRQNEQTVKRIIAIVISPDEKYFEGDAQAELEMRQKCLETIFGLPLGVLGEDDRRNCSRHVRLVYGCEASEIRARLAPHVVCDFEEEEGGMEVQPTTVMEEDDFE